MPLPDITHLQFLVLSVLLHGRRVSGRDVRAALAHHKVKKSGPAFYQLMSRMEDSKWVRGSYEEKVVDGQRIKERWYEILGAGVKAHNDTRLFVLETGKAGAKGLTVG